jgi:GT2 family glycosyltransferase/carbonic anhydrase/acetyltransferase-like protein (isoleucine patch superfamily)
VRGRSWVEARLRPGEYTAVSPYELFAKLRGRWQTFRFVWRLRLRAVAAGGRARVFVRRTNPFDLSWRRRRPLRRIERDVRIEIEPGATVRVYVGDRLTIGAGTVLRIGSGPMYLGDGVTLGPGSIVESGGAVVIRERASIGAGGAVLARGGEAEVHPHAILGPHAAVLAEVDGRSVVGRRARVGEGATLASGAEVDPAGTVGEGTLATGGVTGAPASWPRRRLVSVVCSTKDRAPMLPRLFEALGRQTLPADRFELVIVDNGSSDDTSAVLRRLARSAPFPTRLLRREPPGGPARGRNAGWRAAKAAVVAFTDDDCAPSPEWLESGLAAFEGRDRLAIVQGRTNPEPRQIADLRGLAASQRIEWESGLYETCNLFVRREALEAVGGFAEDIPVPAAEDTELAWKVKGLGWESAFARDAVVDHAVHPGRLRDYPRRFAQWAEVHRTLKRTPAVRNGFFLGHFWTRHHAWYLLFLLALISSSVLVAAAPGWWWLPLVLVLPYVAFLLRSSRESLTLFERVVFAPVRVVADSVEVATMIVGSVRHRAVLL